MNKKRCSKCNNNRLVKFFYKDNVRGRLKTHCNFCQREYSKWWKKTNGAKKFWKRWNVNRRLKHYKLTKEQYAGQLNKQHGKCAVCRAKLKRGKTTHIDHDHKTNKNRGILCSNCNSVLGFAKDNICTLRRAIKYLIKYRRKS